MSAAELTSSGYDEVVLATGVVPRVPDIPGIDHRSVLSYVDVIRGAPVGGRVAVLGAGGIGFDVSEFLTHETVAAAGVPVAAQDIRIDDAGLHLTVGGQSRVLAVDNVVVCAGASGRRRGRGRRT